MVANIRFKQKDDPLESAWDTINEINVSEYYEGKSLSDDYFDKLSTATQVLLTVNIKDDEKTDQDTAIRRFEKLSQVLQVCLEYQSERHDQLAEESEQRMDDVARDLKESNYQEEVLNRRVDELEEELVRARGDLTGNLDDQETRERLSEMERELQDARALTDRTEKELRVIETALQAEKDKVDRLEDDARKGRDGHRGLQDELRDAKEELQELRSQLVLEHEQNIRKDAGDLKLESQLKTKDKMLDRLRAEHKTLSDSLKDSQRKNETYENDIFELDQMIEKMVGDNMDWKRHQEELKDAVRTLSEERNELAQQVAELDGQVEQRMDLLDKFEAHFSKQFEEYGRQIDEITQELATQRTRTPNSPARPASEAQPPPGLSRERSIEFQATVAELKEENRHMYEKEALLMEAYEQLERDVGKEVDLALQKQRTYISQLEAEAERSEEGISKERRRFNDLEAELEKVQRELDDQREYALKYEDEQFGLPEAMRDLKALKQRLRETEDEHHSAVSQYNRQAEKLEDLVEENRALRQKAGMADEDLVDVLGDVKMRSKVEVEHLRALNAQLEAEIADLEEDRRRLRMEMRFRAKWQGENAAKLGLTHAQLLLLEEYAEVLRYGSQPARDPTSADREHRRNHTVVEQLEAQVTNLNRRVATLQAASELSKDEVDQLLGGMHGQREDGDAMAALRRAGGAASGQQVESLRQNSAKLAIENRELRDKTDAAYRELAAVVDGGGDLGPNKEVARALELLSGLEASVPLTAGGAHAPAPPAARPSRAAPRHKERLAALERAVSAGGSDVAREIKALEAELDESAALAARLERENDSLRRDLRHAGASAYGQSMDGLPMLGASAASMEGIMGLSGDARKELHATNLQLLEVLTEQARREDQLLSVGRDLELYKGQMKDVFHQRQLLYRDYVRQRDSGRTESDQMLARIRRLEAQLQEKEAVEREYERWRGAFDDSPEGLKKHLSSALGRLTVAQVKQVRLQRALDSALSAESQLREEKEGLAADMAEMSSTLQARHSQMEKAQQQSQLRVQRLFRRLEDSVPLTVYTQLAEKHAEVSKRYRRVMEERTDVIVAGVEATQARDKVTSLGAEVAMLREDNEGLAEQCRQLARELADDSGPLESRLREEVVQLKVSEANAKRQRELSAKDLERAEDSRRDLQARTKELEAQAERLTATLHATQEAERAALRRLDAVVEEDKYAGVVRRAESAEDRLLKAQSEASDARAEAAAASDKLAQFRAEKHIKAGELNGLRAAIREMQLPNDAAAQLGRAHEEALRLRGEQVQLKHRMGMLEDEADRAEGEARRVRAAMEDRERHIFDLEEKLGKGSLGQREAVQRMEEAVAGRIDSAKAEKWGRALDDLKARNDALQGAVEAATRREADLQEKLQGAEARILHAGDVSRMVGGTVPDAIRENVELAEDNLKLRLAETRLQREVGTQRGKAELMERQRAKAETELQSFEEEALKKEAELRAAADKAARRVAALEEELAETKRELEALSAVADPAAFRRSRRSLDATGAEALLAKEREKDSSRRVRTAQRLQQDQDILLEQIEKITELKKALHDASERASRAEQAVAEDAKRRELLVLERDSLLARLESQAARNVRSAGAGDVGSEETATEHVRAVAQATIHRLQELVDEKNDALDAARRALGAQREAAGKVEGGLREEIERLNQQMYERNDAHIRALKSNLAGTSRVIGGGAGESVEEMMSYDQLQAVLGEREEQVKVLHNRIDQANSKYNILEARFSEQVAAKQAEVDAALQEAERERTRGASRLMENMVSRLKSQLNVKDKKLGQLKEAINQLQARLVDAMKANTDSVMAGSAGKKSEYEADRANQLAGELEGTKRKLLAATEEARKLREREEGLRRAREGIERRAHDAEAKLARLSEELTRERRVVRSYKNQNALARESAEALVTNMPEDPRLEEMERRVAALQAQNTKLKKSLKEAEGGEARETATFVPGRTPPAAAPADGPRRAGGSMLAGNPELERWEEGKKLQKRVEVLRSKLEARSKQLEDADRALARAAEREADLTKELERARTRLRGQAQMAAGPGGTGPPPDTERVRGLAGQLAAAEAERDRLQKALEVDSAREVASLQREVAALREAAAGGEGAARREAWRDGERERLESKLLDQESLAVEARLEAQQARAQVDALKRRIADLFGEEAGGAGGAAPQDKWAERRRPAAPRGNQTTREVHLESVVEGLKKVVEKLKGEKDALARSAGSAQQYVAVSKKYKDLQGKLRGLEEAAAGADKAKAQASEAKARCQQAEAESRNLREQLRRADAAAKRAAGEQQPGAAAGGGLASEEALRTELAAKKQVIEQLRAELKEQEAREGEARARGGGGGDAEVRALRSHVAEVEGRLREVVAENRDLKTELNAFDPKFFEEIEEMKYQHHVMSATLEEYKRRHGALAAAS